MAPLTVAAADPRWEVAVCALVSLGKTSEGAALEPLLRVASSTAWTHRAAALVGLGHLADAGGLATLIAALDDADATVAATAQAVLAKLSGLSEPSTSPEDWRDWWSGTERRSVRLVDTGALRERRERFGYGVPDREIYAGLDVFVIPGRGDHLEGVLEALDIGYREARAGLLPTVGIHPEGIFLAGCTGAIEARDVEPLAWYVRTGGALFTSCWALSETVARTFPGVLGRQRTPGEVTDRVRAAACVSGSDYLDGVFGSGEVVPVYSLEGAHLIHVRDPERAQVLIDSPEAEARHGGGVLAAWFRAGHGVVLDSVNHFESQGLALASGVSRPEERQAYAVDHMGLSYEELREVQAESWWKSSTKAARHVHDMSAFRLITNFVRAKRIGS